MDIPDQSVNLDGINIVERFDGSLDMVLVGTDVTDKDEGVVVFDFTHG